jgi:long-chain acyl-CoA synthetase
VGVPDAVLGERIHVLVVPREDARLDEPELRLWVADRVEKVKRPDVFHFAKELSTSSNGKVDQEALRRRVGALHA